MIDLRPETLCGLKVFVSPDTPKMQLSEDCPVSPDFRKQVNQWMIEFFGMTNAVADGQTLITPWTGITMNPRSYADLKRSTELANSTIGY